jgi:hypothetical protein
MLSRGELAFYCVLRRALQGVFGISIKTRLVDLVIVPPELWDTPDSWRLSQKHVDFDLYDRQTTDIIAVIELDDRSHETPERRQRDRFLNRVFKSVGVPIYHVRAARSYSHIELREVLSSVIGLTTSRQR